MRDTADPDVQDAPPAAPHPDPAPEPDEPIVHSPRPPEPDAEDDEPQPARITPVPLIAMTAETVTAVGAALWQAGGWTAVGLGAAGVAGVGAAVVAGRRRGRTPWRTRSWSPSGSGRKAPASFGSPGRGRSRAGTPSFGGGGKRASGAGRAGGARFPGAGRRTPGAGRVGAAGRRAATTPALAGTGRAARRALRAGGNGLDRATAAASRGRAAARAARDAKRGGASSRGAARAARATLREAHRTTRTSGAWRRMLGDAACGIGAWIYGQLHDWAASLTDAVQWLVSLRRVGGELDDEGEERPRIDTTVDRPTSAAGGHTGGADSMRNKGGGGAPIFVSAAEELAESFRRYEPPPGAGGMVQMYADIGMLPDALDQAAAGLHAFAKQCREDLPLHPAIAEFIDEMANGMAGVASISAELKPAIERLHPEDLDRHRAPRPSEERWNVG